MWTLIDGDVSAVLSKMPENSVDAVVTDPPYGMEFSDTKTGGADVVKVTDRSTNGTFFTKGFKHGIRYGHGRDALIEYQQWTTSWASHLARVVKPGGHLLVFGGTRMFHRLAVGLEDAGFELRDVLGWVYGNGMPHSHNLKGEWDGWGTALKPAYEPILLLRAPLEGTVKKNQDKWGTGAVHITASRTDVPGEDSRWPANLLFNEQGAAELDRSATQNEQSNTSPSKFFYCAKPSPNERHAGLDPETGNEHPTVKPIAVMRWLVTLIAREGAVVLDPFVGSGTTGIAAVSTGKNFIGIDKEPAYVSLAEQRIRHHTGTEASEVPALMDLASEPFVTEETPDENDTPEPQLKFL